MTRIIIAYNIKDDEIETLILGKRDTIFTLCDKYKNFRTIKSSNKKILSLVEEVNNCFHNVPFDPIIKDIKSKIHKIMLKILKEL